MPLKGCVIKNQYFDSVFLMSVNKRLSEEKGVQQSAVLMGSEENKKLLVDLDLFAQGVNEAQANDLVVVLRADTDELCKNILDRVPDFLKGGGGKEDKNDNKTVKKEDHVNTLDPQLKDILKKML